MSNRDDMLSRREVIASLGGLAVSTLALSARAQTEPPPVLFVSHGAPRLPLDPIRRAEMSAWGATLPKPRGIVVMTPHYGRRMHQADPTRAANEVGATGRGFAMYDLPGWLKRRLPQDLDYPSPPSVALAARIDECLGVAAVRGDRRGFDHTTWMPLLYLYPEHAIPVLEMAYPYRDEKTLFALGAKLSPLRREGVLFLGSGQITHNLAALDFAALDAVGSTSPPPAWSSDFDAWATETLAKQDVDAILDWRAKAPSAELAHPDDGGHFRVLSFVLGALLGSGGRAATVRFPVTGFEGSLSKRCVELR